MIDPLISVVAGLQAAVAQAGIRAEHIADLGRPDYRPRVPIQISTSAGPEVRARVSPFSRPLDEGVPGTSGAAMPEETPEGDRIDLASLATVYKANALVLHAATDMANSLIDIFA